MNNLERDIDTESYVVRTQKVWNYYNCSLTINWLRKEIKQLKSKLTLKTQTSFSDL